MTASSSGDRWSPAPLVLSLALATATAGCGDGPADGGGGDLGPESRTYVERLGDDTTALDRFVVGERRIDGILVARSPVTTLTEYSVLLDAAGRPRALTGRTRVPETNPGGPPPRAFSLRVEADTARMSWTEGGDTTGSASPVPEGALPILPRLPYMTAVLERAVRDYRASGGADEAAVFVQPPAGRPTRAPFRIWAGDTLALELFGDPLLVVADAAGVVRYVDGRETTLKVRVAPAEGDPDLRALADSFAARDARGEGMGPASPRATASARVDGAAVTVEYSRPAARGRVVWGGLVPWGELWRTGANAATVLTTSHALVLGDHELPAGSYSLWSVYEPDGAELLVNAETGQWGTAHDPARDLLRVPMERAAPETPAERFTIAVEDTREGGRLTLTWTDRRWVVPFVVR